MLIESKYIIEISDTNKIIRLWEKIPDKYLWKNIMVSIKGYGCCHEFSLEEIRIFAAVHHFETYEEAYEQFVLLCL